MSDCSCGGGTRLVYSCSGAADVGEVADRVTRQLRQDGFAKMTCLAAIGAELSGFIQSAREADLNIAVDGCQVACARKSLERIGVTPLSYILTDMGLTKGKTPITQQIITEMTQKIKEA